MRKIGILGGTFNPVHFGHIKIAKAAIEKADLDSVIFFPSKNPPHKKNEAILPFDVRINLIKKSLEEEENIFVSDLDDRDEKDTYTYYLLQKLEERYPVTRFYFIIGEDNVSELKTWYKYKYLLEHLNFIVFTRQTENLSKWENLDYLSKLTFYQMQPIDISSSRIRERLKKGESIADSVPKIIETEIIRLKKYFEEYAEKER